MEDRANKRASKEKAPARRAVRSGNGHKQAPFKRVTRAQIRAVVKRIVESVHPEKVILFGSYAYGQPTIDSDVDLLVVVQSDERPAKRGMRVERELLDVPFLLDILVRTPEEITGRLAIRDYFIREIVRRGQILYAR